MIEIGIMIEGQESLTWESFLRMAGTVESLGFDLLFRSDHLKPLEVSAFRDTLALWPSLSALAMHTKRIRFGPLVCPMTFRHPALVAKMAASVSLLSNGRLDLGLGAGWYGGEHRAFGIRYPRYADRLEMLEEGTQVIRQLWAGKPSSFSGKHYQLEDAAGLMLPDPIPIIMGGKGEKTLQVVALRADEWNCSYVGVDVFKEKSLQLDDNCDTLGRDPASLRRSLMTPFVIGKDGTQVQRHIDAHRMTFPSLPANLTTWLEAGFIGGSPAQVSDQMSTFADGGTNRFMLQQNALDDLDSLALLANEVMPHFRS
jgi:alkanesulfonate monooxygenase SsuD/methylene tetrahydromethanopterin reductase-like flavin-dependent oxidoreductase (luciferase family)